MCMLLVVEKNGNGKEKSLSVMIVILFLIVILVFIVNTHQTPIHRVIVITTLVFLIVYHLCCSAHRTSTWPTSASLTRRRCYAAMATTQVFRTASALAPLGSAYAAFPEFSWSRNRPTLKGKTHPPTSYFVMERQGPQNVVEKKSNKSNKKKKTPSVVCHHDILVIPS